MKKIRAVSITIRNDEILLMHRIKDGFDYYTFPGGGVEVGETVEKAVVRELIEEATMKVKVGKLLYHHIYDNNSEQFFYLCKHVSGEPKLGNYNEAQNMAAGNNFYEPVWYKISEINKLTLFPIEIRDWLIEDHISKFVNTPRNATIPVSELRKE
ncbi:MAG: NUDIX domain-containing protein [Candidatus Saccharibacteria bacterium]